MSIAIILASSLIVLIVVRMIMILLYWILGKIFKSSKDVMKFDLVMSVAFYIIYIQGFLGTAQGILQNNKLSNAEWYFIYTFIGISSIIWCYFSWDLKWKARPQFAKVEIPMIIKKIIVFFLVMVFAFYYGYTQLNENFGGSIDEEEKLLATLTNITIISGIIAFDRVLNQVSNYLKVREANK